MELGILVEAVCERNRNQKNDENDAGDTCCAFQRDRLSGWKNDVRNGHVVSRFYRVRITGTTDWLTAYNVTGRLGEPPPTRRRRDSSCLRSSGVPYSLHYCLGGETTEQKRSNATRSRLYSNHAPEHLSRFRLFPLPSLFFPLSLPRRFKEPNTRTGSFLHDSSVRFTYETLTPFSGGYYLETCSRLLWCSVHWLRYTRNPINRSQTRICADNNR